MRKPCLFRTLTPRQLFTFVVISARVIRNTRHDGISMTKQDFHDLVRLCNVIITVVERLETQPSRKHTAVTGPLPLCCTCWLLWDCSFPKVGEWWECGGFYCYYTTSKLSNVYFESFQKLAQPVLGKHELSRCYCCWNNLLSNFSMGLWFGYQAPVPD